MKKRIFIAIHYLEIGGAEMSLIGLLQALDYTKYDVDLFVYSHRGELMKYIPKEVNLLPEIGAYSYIEKPIKDALKHGYIGVSLGRLWAKFQFRNYAKKHPLKDRAPLLQYVAENVSPFLPSLKKYGEYDLAISYLTPHHIVLQKIKAKKKVAWIHTDYSRIGVQIEKELPIWSGYDHIISISPDVTRNFLQVFPSLKDKIVEMENILSSDFVRSRAEELAVIPFNDNVINLLSVGRYTEAKNFDNIPDICKRINQKMKVKWYIIGYGSDENLIRKRIEEAGMQEHVILLGKKENPYPYIKACDFYVQPSRYEGKAVTVREAQILCKPVAVAHYATAPSQVQHGVDGVIVRQDNEKCAEGIIKFIEDKMLQNRIVSYLHQHDYGNKSEVEKLYNII